MKVLDKKNNAVKPETVIVMGFQVKETWFLRLKCPGLPIYVFESGQIAVPFLHKKLNIYLWYTEAEMTANITDEKELEAARIPFKEAKDEIARLKQQKAGI